MSDSAYRRVRVRGTGSHYRVVRDENYGGQDGVLAWPDPMRVGDGSLPRWLPLSAIEPAQEPA